MTCKHCTERLETVLTEATEVHESADKLNRKYLGVPDWVAEDEFYRIAKLPKSERRAVIQALFLEPVEDFGNLENPPVVRDDFYFSMLEAEVV